MRPRFPVELRLPARRRRFEFIALLTTPHIDDAIEDAGGHAGELEIEVRARAADAGRLATLLAGRAGHGLAALPDDAQHAIAAAGRYASITADLPDGADLSALRRATAIARALAEADDLVAWLDVATARWWLPAELSALAPERPFDLDEHVQVVVESVERRPGHGHVVRSRGLPKLARPDVCARAPRREAELVSEVVRDVARLLAEGAEAVPGERLAVRGLPPVALMPRSDGALDQAPAASAPLVEICDAQPDGIAPGCPALLAALKPRPRLKVVR